jgi:hypothetical protein
MGTYAISPLMNIRGIPIPPLKNSLIEARVIHAIEETEGCRAAFSVCLERIANFE